MADMDPLGSGQWKALTTASAIFAAGAFLGRLAWHTVQVRAGKRRFWSLDLLWEVPLALFCGAVAGGVGVHFELHLLVIVAGCSLLGYLGPRGVEVIFYRVLDRLAPANDSRDKEKDQ